MKKFFKKLIKELKDIKTFIVFVIVFIVMSTPTWLGFILYWCFKWKWSLAMGSGSLLFWNVIPCTPFFPICVAITLFIKKILNRKKDK